MAMAMHVAPMPQPSEGRSAQEDARVRREADIIAEGHAELDAGNGIELEALERWLDALDEDETTPLPTPRTAAPRV